MQVWQVQRKTGWHSGVSIKSLRNHIHPGSEHRWPKTHRTRCSPYSLGLYMTPELATVVDHMRVASGSMRGRMTMEAERHLVLGHISSEGRRWSVAEMHAG